MHTSIHCSTLYNSQDMKAIQVFNNKRVDNETVIYIHIYINITQWTTTPQFQGMIKSCNSLQNRMEVKQVKRTRKGTRYSQSLTYRIICLRNSL